MKTVLHARNATVVIEPIVLNNVTDFLVENVKKEVIYLKSNLIQPKLISLKQQLIQMKTTFESTFRQMATSPKLMAIGIPGLDTSTLPPEIVKFVFGLIAALLLAAVLLGIVNYILASGLNLLNRPQDADKWQKNIRKGVIQALVAPVIIMLLVFIVHFFLSGLPGYVPIYKNQP